MKPAMHRLRLLRYAATPSVTILLLAAAGSAEAGWLARGIGVAGAGAAVTATLDRTTGIFDKMMDAVISDDSRAASALERELEKTPGTIITKAFPVLDAADAVADRVKSAKRKIDSLVDKSGEGLADARTALATWGNTGSGSGSEAAILEGEPLPAPVDTEFVEPRRESSDEVLAALREESGLTHRETDVESSVSPSDFEQWVIAEQEGRPHCYGVVDPDTLPPDCFEPLPSAKPVEAEQSQDEVAGNGTDWASGNWTVEGSGWSGWDTDDLRYSDEDRQTARVNFYAARCWGVYGVSKREPTWILMKEKMERNECPNEEADQPDSHETDDEYARALDTVVSGGSDAASSDSQLAALDALEAKETEPRQIEGEVERQDRLEEEGRRERAVLASDCQEYTAALDQYFDTQRESLLAVLSGESFDQQKFQDELQDTYNRLRVASRAVDVDFDGAMTVAMEDWPDLYLEAAGMSMTEIRRRALQRADDSKSAFVRHGHDGSLCHG